jgi:hypothetical protein
LVNRPITEQLELWASIDVDVWQCAHVKTIQLPEKLSSLRQKLYLKAKQEVMAPFVGVLRVPSGEVQGKAGKSACPVVCPAKAGMFSRSQSCRGNNQKPRSLDGR